MVYQSSVSPVLCLPPSTTHVYFPSHNTYLSNCWNLTWKLTLINKTLLADPDTLQSSWHTPVSHNPASVIIQTCLIFPYALLLLWALAVVTSSWSRPSHKNTLKIAKWFIPKSHHFFRPQDTVEWLRLFMLHLSTVNQNRIAFLFHSGSNQRLLLMSSHGAFPCCCDLWIAYQKSICTSGFTNTYIINILKE